MMDEVVDGKQFLDFEEFCHIVRQDSNVFSMPGSNVAETWVKFNNRATRDLDFKFSGDL